MSAPVIGITRCGRLDDYLESIERAGGTPRVLDAGSDPEAALDGLDGLLLTGGADVDPGLYGQPPHPRTEADAARDAFEIPVAGSAIARDLPILAVCRGVQVLNVAAGGNLIQDIPSDVSTTIDHAINTPKDAIAHDVSILAGSRLAGALGQVQAHRGSCAVNSRHHQAVGRVAPAFTVTAVAPDGVIEAIEKPDATFCVGVQWHPENFGTTMAFDPLFRAFIDAARAVRG